MPEPGGSGSTDPGTKGDKPIEPGSRAQRPATTRETTVPSGSGGSDSGTKDDKGV